MEEKRFILDKKPNDGWRLESSKKNEEYPKLIFGIDIKKMPENCYFILDCNAKIMVERWGDKSKTLEISCAPRDKLICQNDKELSFSTTLTPTLFNKIESFRSGDNLRARIIIERLFLISYSQGNKSADKDYPETQSSYIREVLISGSDRTIDWHHHTVHLSVTYDASQFIDNDHRLIIMRDAWSKKVLSQYGMGDRFIIEIPSKLPSIPAGTPREKELNVLKERLEKNIGLLKGVVEEYNEKRDHEKCVMNVRKISDPLHKLGHNTQKSADLSRLKLYGKHLIENTRTGSPNISQDMIEDVLAIADKIFNQASKGPHGVTTGKQGSQQFEYTPDQEDAEMLLGIISLIYYWMGKKFEKSMIKKVILLFVTSLKQTNYIKLI
ncbi:Uncharacterised protein [uncultured archaeon]|nr:Uncharacterised protein [uncultured archaeon]